MLMLTSFKDNVVIGDYYLIKNFNRKSLKYLIVRYSLKNTNLYDQYMYFLPDNYSTLPIFNNLLVQMRINDMFDNIHYYDSFWFKNKRLASYIRVEIEEILQQSLLELLYD